MTTPSPRTPKHQYPHIGLLCAETDCPGYVLHTAVPRGWRISEAEAAPAGGLREALAALVEAETHFTESGGLKRWTEAWKQARAALAAPSAPAGLVEWGVCGSLDWTVEKWGRVTHKHACPNRTDPWCQTHPDKCAYESDG